MVQHTPVWRTAWILGVAVLLAIAATGCASGASNANVTIHTGTAHAGIDQVGIKGDDGWYYDIPSDVMWTDSAGTWHDGEWPACLPATGQSARVRFASTQVTVNGTTWRPVVWVSCQSS